MKIHPAMFLIFLIAVSGCSSDGNMEPAPIANVPKEAQPPMQPISEAFEQQIPAPTTNPNNQPYGQLDQPSNSEQNENKWEGEKPAVLGNYADADVVEYESGKFRMYYGLQPEVAGFKGQIYSAISTDGVVWTEEKGERMDGATFPSVIKLSDGRFRMYHQSAGVIKSSISTDGLTWKQESGTRIGTENTEGLYLTRVGSPTVVKTEDEYVMVYFGSIGERYPEKVPNPDTHLFLWATSPDGINFEGKGIAFDSRNENFKGWVDGPEFAQWDSELRLYFWGYGGVYHVTFDGASFSLDAAFDYLTPQDNPLAQFPSNPPGDPALAKIAGKWLMYYGQHPEGIFYATYKN